MRAGEAAGGDKRGKQSAALLIHGERGMVRRSICASTIMPIRSPNSSGSSASAASAGCISGKFLPTRQNPAGITDRATIDAGIAAATAGETHDGKPARSRSGICACCFTATTAAPPTRSTASISRVANGATLGLVGESGCGKSVTSLAIMGLLPKQIGRGLRRDPLRRLRSA